MEENKLGSMGTISAGSILADSVQPHLASTWQPDMDADNRKIHQ